MGNVVFGEDVNGDKKSGYLIAAQQTKQERQIRFAEKGRKNAGLMTCALGKDHKMVLLERDNFSFSI